MNAQEYYLPSGTKLPTGRELPQLFNFTENEMKIQPALNSQLIPPHVAQQAAAGAAAGASPMAAGATSAGATGAELRLAGAAAVGRAGARCSGARRAAWCTELGP